MGLVSAGRGSRSIGAGHKPPETRRVSIRESPFLPNGQFQPPICISK